jgi:hypothetical protein
VSITSADIVIWNALRDRLMSEHGLEEDDPAVFDTLDGELSLADRLADLLRAALESEALAEALGLRLKDMQDRKARLEHRAKVFRREVAKTALAARIPKMEREDFTASFTLPDHGPVDVPDIEAVPTEYCRIKKEPDKKRIAELLKGGLMPNWAKWSEPQPRATVRTR